MHFSFILYVCEGRFETKTFLWFLSSHFIINCLRYMFVNILSHG
jgi:hypothetical protein